MHLDQTILLYMAEAVLAAIAFVCLLAYLRCKDIGYPIMAGVLTSGAVISFFFNAWWSLAAALIIFLAIIVLGSGIFKKDYERV